MSDDKKPDDPFAELRLQSVENAVDALLSRGDIPGEQGPQGFQGAQGEQGEQGAQGRPGEVRFSGGGGSAPGEQGPQGFQGANGSAAAGSDVSLARALAVAWFMGSC